jgi:hypothetical protein
MVIGSAADCIWIRGGKVGKVYRKDLVGLNPPVCHYTDSSILK